MMRLIENDTLPTQNNQRQFDIPSNGLNMFRSPSKHDYYSVFAGTIFLRRFVLKQNCHLLFWDHSELCMRAPCCQIVTANFPRLSLFTPLLTQEQGQDSSAAFRPPDVPFAVQERPTSAPSSRTERSSKALLDSPWCDGYGSMGHTHEAPGSDLGAPTLEVECQRTPLQKKECKTLVHQPDRWSPTSRIFERISNLGVQSSGVHQNNRSSAKFSSSCFSWQMGAISGTSDSPTILAVQSQSQQDVHRACLLGFRQPRRLGKSTDWYVESMQRLRPPSYNFSPSPLRHQMAPPRRACHAKNHQKAISASTRAINFLSSSANNACSSTNSHRARQCHQIFHCAPHGMHTTIEGFLDVKKITILILTPSPNIVVPITVELVATITIELVVPIAVGLTLSYRG